MDERAIGPITGIISVLCSLLSIPMYSYSSAFVGCMILTVNVPVVNMAWDFLGPEMATSEESAI